MANLAARRAPNVSQYLANLNVVRPDRDNSLSQDDATNFEDDLNLFTNAEFLDFPVDDNALEQSAFNYYDERPRQANVPTKKEYPDGMEMVNSRYTPVTELSSCVLLAVESQLPCEEEHPAGALQDDLTHRSRHLCRLKRSPCLPMY